MTMLYEFIVTGQTAHISRVAIVMGGLQEITRNRFEISVMVAGACN